MKKLTRSYNISIYPNYQKLEDIRYSVDRFKLYTNHFLVQLYHRPHLKFLSTQNMGTLANQAQKQAIDLLRGERGLSKTLEKKVSLPIQKFDMTPATIGCNKNSSFDYWVTLLSQWKNKVQVPAKSYSLINKKLKEGWELSKHCEVYKNSKGKWRCKIFVTKEVEIPKPNKNNLGIDVGIAHSSSRSDGYLGPNLKKVIKKEKNKQAERQRQKHPKKSTKTVVKQILDRDVNLAIRRSKKLNSNIVVENPKTLANLKVKGYLNKWARSYFANRLNQRAIEEGVFVVWINPAYTSISCSRCGKIDKLSRVNQSLFKCTECGNTLNADYNAALNIALKGQVKLIKLVNKVPEGKIC